MTNAKHPETYLHSILNAFSDLIFVFDGDGVILDYLKDENSEWLYKPREQFLGRNNKEILPDNVSSKIDQALQALKNGETKYTFDYNILLNGRYNWFTAVFSPIHEDTEKITKYLCVIREITAKKESELLLQGVLQNAFNSFIVLQAIRNTNGYIIDFELILANHQAEKLIGKSPDDLIHKSVRGFDNQQWILWDKFSEVVETGNDLDLEYDINNNETFRWVNAHASKYGDGLVITIQDITEKKRSELDLQAALDQLKVYSKQMDLFFTQALTGFFFMMFDKPIQWDETIDKDVAIDYALNHLHFTRVNAALLKQYGATYTQLTNRTLKDFFKNDLETGKSILRQLYDQKHIHINRTSKKFDGSEIWFEGDYICFMDDNNNILGHFGTQQDVTERKHAEELLRASEERYRLLANNMLDLVALHDPDGTYKYVSPSVTNILGYTPDELIGTNPYILFHPDDVLSIQNQSHSKAKEGEDVPSIEYRIQKKNGQYIWFSTNTKAIKDINGKVTMLQTVSRDITERANTLHLLEELNQQKNKLFSIISHDLRGPIGNCLGLLNLLRSDVPVEDVPKYLAHLHTSVSNVHSLLDDLLLWAGSQLDKISFEPTHFQIKEEATIVTNSLTEMAKQKNISIYLNIGDNSITGYGDKPMIRTILRNLLSNAIKFSKPGNHVIIEAKKKNNMLEISVKDHGMGIKKENLEKLFDKTSNFTTYGTKGERGTGLGLDICKDFVDKHQGKIWVESEFEKGSTFIFTLPIPSAATK
ncbi:PAS domain S-box protein [Chryseolinea sp. H1M3-3]|uniref:PAS domain-containing protein n=1 Tax=Chryseolinea sp. H1M3-3 TaxID=3034144 RepID=UPI0023EAD421|nr:PAS domain S-box protein [Chryseolinea sp. H1M3-3]